ncbi:hypothetical protein H5200_12230 [Pseudoalteromonas sp. SG43-7]|uniref:hypothetical protein n=1 Tax=Pseudoalteromonas sp. SG43-7 TaxID=2760966 RepID=UPI001600620C|nr:hypothetical protein [Pseudoalteromonas sp. SG43-7]MBB1422688.1 hypothetical protein [Pseudoalteromonas sp. SG43-7]
MQKLAKCPHCRGLLDISAIAHNKASDELLCIYTALPGQASAALADYVQLFTPDKSDLSHARQLKLSQDIIELTKQHDLAVFTQALTITVASIRDHWERNGYRRMGDDHAYLQKVLGTEQQKFLNSQTSKKFVSANQAIEMKVERPETLQESTQKWQENLAKYRS